MDEVVLDDGAGLDAEGVDAAHVAEHVFADVMEIVECDEIAAGLILSVAPGPADGDGGVEEIVDVVMDDLVVSTLQHPYSYSACVDVAEIVDVVVGDFVVVVLFVHRSGRRAGSPSLIPPAPRS